MSGTVIITGANGTLALGFVKALLERHPQQVLLATVRNSDPEKDMNTAKLFQIVAKYPKSKVEIRKLDLGRLDDVRDFATEASNRIAAAELPPISAIVCNAATVSFESGQKTTSDGFEATFQVSHLAHYLMVLRLLGSMSTESGRIVLIGSITHYAERANALTAFKPTIPEDPRSLAYPEPDEEGLAHDRGQQRYGTSKLCQVTFMHDLNKRLKQDPALSKITVISMDPGGLPSSRSQGEQKKSIQRLMATLNFCMPVLKHLITIFRTPEAAGQDLVTVSLAPEFHGKRGYYVGLKEDLDSAMSRDPAVQARLWATSWRLAGLSRDQTALTNAAP